MAGFWQSLFGGPVAIPDPDAHGVKPSRSFHSKVAGIARRQDAAATVRAGEMVALVREPDNPHDPAAIAVWTADRRQLGYLPAATAADLAGDMDSGVPAVARIANVTGGTAERPTIGVNLQIMIFDKLRQPPKPD